MSDKEITIPLDQYRKLVEAKAQLQRLEDLKAQSQAKEREALDLSKAVRNAWQERTP